MKYFIVMFPTYGVPPVRIFASQYLRDEMFTIFTDDKGKEVAWFNTIEIGGVWIVNEEPMVVGHPASRRVRKENLI